MKFVTLYLSSVNIDLLNTESIVFVNDKTI